MCAASWSRSWPARSILRTIGESAADVWPVRSRRNFTYWPPPPSSRSRLVELPSGKKFFVFMGKRDADGKLEPVVCFIDR
ncbi:uncharacterized protein BcabD6B2_24710 [Babesia caballi]|uniref:Uncharacterized protein n=1 Tax=Babesia caballi TaxID=5871 RepID=A0AAV4LT58_BABCB|nr:hypothetical protein, conserved [Babesia caballi]